MLLPAVFHENLFDDWFDPFFDDMDREMNRESHQVFGKRGANMMKTDVKDTGSAYGWSWISDHPGCPQPQQRPDRPAPADWPYVHGLENGYLTIQAVRSHSNDQTDKEGRYVRRESFSGTCARSFYVGEDVKKEDIHAKFEDGVLKFSLPHPQAQQELPAANQNLIEIE